jgi:hypothetical protein
VWRFIFRNNLDISDLVDQLSIMVGISLVKIMPFLASCAFASVNYPQIPKDLTTPFQQRLAVYGPNGKHLDSIPP